MATEPRLTALETPWTAVPAATADLLVPGADLEPQAALLLTPSMTPSAFCTELIANDLVLDAIRLLAQALPHRLTVAWALQCAREAGVRDPTDGQLLVLAERWVREPHDDAGRAAFALAETAGFKSAAAWVGVACFWSGASMAPPNVPAVPPGPTLAGKAASGAVLLAAAAGVPGETPARQRHYFDLGTQYATGKVAPPS